jgi:hypothetical protein
MTSEEEVMSSVIVKVGGTAAVLAGLLIVGQEVWDLIAGPTGEGPGESAVHSAWVLMIVFALVGLYLRQQREIGVFGQIATLVALLGTVTLFGTALLEVLAVPGGDQGEVYLGSVPVWMLVIFPSFALYVVGLLLFAIAIWRARVLPRQAAVALALGILAALTLKPFVPGIMAIFGVAWIWLGAAALRPVRTSVTQPEPNILAGTRSAGGH